MIREYIRNQESEERREEATQMGLFQPPLGGKGRNKVPGPMGPVPYFSPPSSLEPIGIR